MGMCYYLGNINTRAVCHSGHNDLPSSLLRTICQRFLILCQLTEFRYSIQRTVVFARLIIYAASAGRDGLATFECEKAVPYIWNLYKDFCVHLFLVNDHEADVPKPGQVRTTRAHKYRYMGEAREVLIYSY